MCFILFVKYHIAIESSEPWKHARSKKPVAQNHVLWFPSYEMSRVGKPVESTWSDWTVPVFLFLQPPLQPLPLCMGSFQSTSFPFLILPRELLLLEMFSLGIPGQRWLGKRIHFSQTSLEPVIKTIINASITLSKSTLGKNTDCLICLSGRIQLCICIQ